MGPYFSVMASFHCSQRRPPYCNGDNCVNSPVSCLKKRRNENAARRRRVLARTWSGANQPPLPPVPTILLPLPPVPTILLPLPPVPTILWAEEDPSMAPTWADEPV